MRGGIYAKLSGISSTCTKAFAINGVNSKIGGSIFFNLKNHRTFFFVSTQNKSTKSYTVIKKSERHS